MRAMLTALATIIETRSCGVATTITPSSGRDWKTVSGTSPVPGGMSTSRQSTSPQITSVQNCLTAPPRIGPRQRTGAVSSSSRRLIDMIWTPPPLSAGTMPVSRASRHSLTPNALGIEGPVMSASRIAALLPALDRAEASSAVTVDLPTPPLPDTTAIAFFTCEPGLAWASRLSCVRSPQSALVHDEQLPEQASLIFSAPSARCALYVLSLF